jgi:hypothetical protein
VVFQLVLVEPVRFPQESARTVARDRAANLAAGHNSHSSRDGRCIEGVQHRQPAFDATARGVDLPKLGVALQALTFGELTASMQGTGLDREAFAALAAATAQGGATALGAGALQESEATLSAAF